MQRLRTFVVEDVGLNLGLDLGLKVKTFALGLGLEFLMLKA